MAGLTRMGSFFKSRRESMVGRDHTMMAALRYPAGYDLPPTHMQANTDQSGAPASKGNAVSLGLI